MSVFRVGSNKSSVNNFPSVRPTLDLDFANSKTLDPRITFTRASGGSYVGADGLIKYAGVNEARFDHDPVTGESLGLLVEESRTNLLLRSEEFDNNASWENIGIVAARTANTVLAPNGTTTADTVTVAGAGTLHFTYQDLACTASTQYTFSFYVRLGTLPSSDYGFAVRDNTGAAFIGSAVIPIGLPSSTWVRVSHTFTTPVGCVSLRVYPYRQNAVTGGTIFLWGAQLEQGSFPTSYIPTEGSTRTRSADNASITGKNFSEWYRPDEGTVYCRYNRIGIQAASTTVPTPWGVSVGTFSNSMTLIGGYSVPSNRRFDIINSGSTTAQLDFTGTETAQTFNKVCVTYKLNDIAGSYNAQTVLTDTSSNIPSVNQLCIGRRDPTTLLDYLNGNISRLTYYPKRLSNAQLQALTK